jgi:hypothetical protein
VKRPFVLWRPHRRKLALSRKHFHNAFLMKQTGHRYQLIAKLRHTVKPFMLMLKEKIFGTYVEIAEFIRI